MAGPRKILIGALLALCLPAAAHRLRVYPNPNLTVYSLAEGPDGLLWLATSDGLYRFDGFHYQKIPSYPFSTARFVAFTRDGSLWCGGLEGLARLHNRRFETVVREEVMSLAAYPGQLFARLGSALTRIGLDGSLRRLRYQARRDLHIDSAGHLWFVCVDSKDACWIDPERPDGLHRVALPALGYDIYEAVQDSRGRLWAGDAEHAALVESGGPAMRLERLHATDNSRPGSLLPGRNGQLWFLGETVRGLVSPVEFRGRRDNSRFPPVCGLEDSRGHLWVFRSGQGLVEWIPGADWQRWFPEDYAGDLADHVVRAAGGPAVLATQRNLYRQDAKARQWSRLGPEERRYYSLLPLAERGFLASTGKPGSGRLLRLSSEGRVLEQVPNLLPAPDDYRKILRDSKGRLWVGSRRALFRIEGRPGGLHLVPENLPGLAGSEPAQAVDLEVDRGGRLWVGYSEGIAWLDDQERWHKLATDQPVTMVRSFALAGDDIWVSHRRMGAFSRLHRDGERWNVTLFAANAGYDPEESEFLQRDSRGWIWRGSSDGVHVFDGRHLAPGDWLHLGLENGLASNETGQYGFFEDTDGSVWVTGEEGVTHLRPDPAWFEAPHGAPAPRVTRVEADGHVFVAPEEPPGELPADTKVLRIDVGTLAASGFRDDPLRYRLLPLARDWRPARGAAIEFQNLVRKAYRLEIGYAGQGASAVAAYVFRIGPPGATVPWPWMVAVLLVCAALLPVLRRQRWFAKAEFRVEKAVFLMRRRRHNRRLHGSDQAPGEAHYAGETLLGRYRLGRLISRGGFSLVFEARDLRESGRVAVKVLNRGAVEAGWVRDRFAHEVAALRSVAHPGVVPILDAWIGRAGDPCLAMPYLEGPTLRSALQHGPLERGRAARLIRQLGAALTEIHAHGVVHRDLKPENLVLLRAESEGEQIVIIDFGTAGLRSGENELAATTMMSGSLQYMAPERLTGRFSPASDIFSLAVIVLEMLAGKRLSEVAALPSDPSFASELELVLRGGLDERRAAAVVQVLAPAFHADPRRRPGEVGRWSEGVALRLF